VYQIQLKQQPACCVDLGDVLRYGTQPSAAQVLTELELDHFLFSSPAAWGYQVSGSQ
jgi:hypothetical protein